jgi:hypothetical protein
VGDPLKKQKPSVILIILIAVGSTVLVGLIAYALRDVARAVFGTPITYILTIGKLFIESTPQILCWGWLLFILVVAFYRSLSGKKKEIERETLGYAPAGSRERIAPLSLRIMKAARGNRFAWLLLGEQLGDLTIKVLSHVQRVPGRDIRRMIANKEIKDVPENVARSVEMRYRPDYFTQADTWAQVRQFFTDFWAYTWKRDKSRNPFAASQRQQEQIADIVDYLESQLGLKNK